MSPICALGLGSNFERSPEMLSIASPVTPGWIAGWECGVGNCNENKDY